MASNKARKPQRSHGKKRNTTSTIKDAAVDPAHTRKVLLKQPVTAVEKAMALLEATRGQKKVSGTSKSGSDKNIAVGKENDDDDSSRGSSSNGSSSSSSSSSSDDDDGKDKSKKGRKGRETSSSEKRFRPTTPKAPGKENAPSTNTPVTVAGTTETMDATPTSIAPSDLALNKAISVSSVTHSGMTGSASTSRCEVASVAKTVEGLIPNVVNTSIFPFMKFLTCDAEMDASFPHFGQKIMAELKVSSHSQSVWWGCYKLLAKKALNQKRSSVGAAIKASVLGLLAKKTIEPNWFFNVLSMRDDVDGAYSLFCDSVLSHVVGRDIWKKRCATHDIKDIATISDEAFALFIVENSWEFWVAMSAKEEAIPTTKYSQRGPGIKKYGGWTEDGINRFNQLFDVVAEDRASNNGVFDTEYKERKFAELTGKKKRKRKADHLPAVKHVQARIEPPTTKVTDIRRTAKV